MIASRIVSVRSVLLSAPYSDRQDDLEVILHLPSGWRTTGLVEIVLDNGVIGLGEGYLAVFAPHVFEKIVDLVAPVLIGADPANFALLYRQISLITGYWSLQGAAQHVVSAVEIALQDCRAQMRGIPVWRLLGTAKNQPLKLYASGGDGTGPDAIGRELVRVNELGIELLKIRARKHQAEKVRWCQTYAAKRGVAVAVDMGQNLVIPSQSVEDIQRFLAEVTCDGGPMPVFLEEALGPEEIHRYPFLRERVRGTRIAGGEIVTTGLELCQRIEQGCYEIVQPDATVLGGIDPVLTVFTTAKANQVDVFVHCWGGPVGMMANYHAAVAAGGTMAEWPMKSYSLRDAMAIEPWNVTGGKLTLSERPGLGVRLTPEIEREYAFREDAVYRCLADPALVPTMQWK